ncbi:MAG: hypothetical protein K8I04_06870 [Gammaproteobacteria bacterium]|nr:hypothetical protein [Gammaproteobacteria bacterium]
MEYVIEIEEGCPVGPAGARVVCSDELDPAPRRWVLVEGPGGAPALTRWPTRWPWLATLVLST